MSVQSPPKILVERYLIEIAKNYNVEYTPDEQVMREDEGEVLNRQSSTKVHYDSQNYKTVKSCSNWFQL